MWYHPFGATFHYMSSRNNDFTNRSMKATIIVKAWRLSLILGAVGLLPIPGPPVLGNSHLHALRPGASADYKLTERQTIK